jgi:hypothetical protein
MNIIVTVTVDAMRHIIHHVFSQTNQTQCCTCTPSPFQSSGNFIYSKVVPAFRQYAN